MKNFTYYEKWFTDYANELLKELTNSPDNYHLKITHTKKVVENTLEILKSLSLSEKVYKAAVLSALFHDIGRFRQYIDFGTFKDAISVDHGELGVEILNTTGILADLDSEIADIVVQTVSLHNKHAIPKGLSDDCLTVLKIIRDADKVDILRVVIEQYKMEESNNTVMLGLSGKDGISFDVYSKIMNKESVGYTELKSAEDFKALQLGWVYDINYDCSLSIIHRNNYIKEIYESMIKNKFSLEIYKSVMNFLDNQLKGGI